MSRTDNESRSSRPGGELNGARAEPFRILRLYSIEKKDPKKPGPPKKSLQLTLEHLPADMAFVVREQIEAQLRPQQALEVDGVLVARGADVGPDDIESFPELKGDLGEAYSFAHRMLWEVYERETAAIDRLSERSAEMFKRNFDMTLQLQRAIQETLELQGALRAVFEGETIRTNPKAGAPKPEEEEGFNIRNIKDWVAGLSTLKDVVSEVSKVAKDLKDMKSSQPAGASDGSQA